MTALSAEDQTSLTHLRWHWEDAYEINFDGETWEAVGKFGSHDRLTGKTSAELLSKIRDHYADHMAALREERMSHMGDTSASL